MMHSHNIEPDSEYKLTIRWHKVAGLLILILTSVMSVALYYKVFRWLIS